MPTIGNLDGFVGNVKEASDIKALLHSVPNNAPSDKKAG
jgi:hypothetical protein